MIYRLLQIIGFIAFVPLLCLSAILFVPVYVIWNKITFYWFETFVNYLTGEQEFIGYGTKFLPPPVPPKKAHSEYPEINTNDKRTAF